MRLTERELYELYDEMLDECYGDNGTVKIGPYDYCVSRALRLVDPVAYRVGFNDWSDSEGWIENGEGYIKE